MDIDGAADFSASRWDMLGPAGTSALQVLRRDIKTVSFTRVWLSLKLALANSEKTLELCKLLQILRFNTSIKYLD